MTTDTIRRPRPPVAPFAFAAPVAFAALLALVGASTTPALARPGRGAHVQARTLFEQAEQYFYAGRFSEALPLYRRAHALTRLPGFLFNIAQCHRYLGQHVEALAHYRDYLQQYPGAPNRVLVERLIALSERDVTRDAASRPHVATPAPSPTPMSAPAPTPTPMSASAPAPTPTPMPATATAPADEPAPTAVRAGPSRLLLWSGFGLAAALTVTGAVTGVWSIRDSHEYNADANPAQAERYEALRDRGRRLATISWITLGAGAVVGATTALYYWLGVEDTKRQRDADHAVSVGPTPGGAAFLVRGSF